MPADKRTGFLKNECGNDNELLCEIESLLRYSDSADQFIHDLTANIISPSLANIFDSRCQSFNEDELQIIGQKISHYHILEKLGNGGMGVVYKARDTKLGRTVALKFLMPRLLQSDEVKQQLILEAQAAAALNHHNICTIHQIDEFDGKQFIVMEFIEGVTMREKLTSQTSDSGIRESGTFKLPVKSAIDYTIQIAEALLEAQDKEIVHRDIKPENIMVDSKNRIKVMDFGLAKIVGNTDLTMIRSALGSLAYMSPEQIQRSSVDHRSDIFSLGIVLYEMLTGQNPFQKENEADTLSSIVNKDPPPLSEFIPECPPEVIHLIGRMLSKNWGNRYQTINDLLYDLRHCTDTLTGPVTKNITFPISPRLFRLGLLSSVIGLLFFLFAGYIFLSSDFNSTEGNPYYSIAVLELENLSPDPDDAYFADGIHEEVINRLTGISSITVIARSSVIGYPPEERDLQLISEELGVTTVMEGAVQRIGERLRVSMKLTDTESNATVWSGTYEDHIDGIYEIQSRIAREVAEALEATPAPDEENRLDEHLTESSEAYDFYMRAREYHSRPGLLRDHYQTTEMLLKKALEEDPMFAHAYALLAITYSNLYWFFGQTPERLQQIKEAAEQAQQLAPDLPETHLALGLYFYWSDADYQRPLSHFESALQQFPNHPQLHIFMGLTYRWAGNWEKSEGHLKKALELDPRNISTHQELSWLYIWIREYDKAEARVIRQINMFPDMPFYLYLAYINYHRDGSFEGVKTWGEMRPVMVELEIYFYGLFNYYNRNWEGALQAYESIETEIAIDTDNDYIPRLYLIAKTLEAKGDSATPLTYYKQIQEHLEELRDEYPDDPRYRITLGKVYARMGEPEKAIREGEKAVDLVPYEQNTFRGAWLALDLAEIYTLAEKHDEAIDQLEFVLSVPGFVSKNDLRLSPKWDPLRDHIKFQNLIES